MSIISKTERLENENKELRAQVAKLKQEADAILIDQAIAEGVIAFKAELGYPLANDKLVKTALAEEAKVERGEGKPKVVFIDKSDGLPHVRGNGTPQTAQERLGYMKDMEEWNTLFAPVKGAHMHPANYDELSPLEQLTMSRRFAFAQNGGGKGGSTPQRPAGYDSMDDMEKAAVDRAIMLEVAANNS